MSLLLHLYFHVQVLHEFIADRCTTKFGEFSPCGSPILGSKHNGNVGPCRQLRARVGSRLLSRIGLFHPPPDFCQIRFSMLRVHVSKLSCSSLRCCFRAVSHSACTACGARRVQVRQRWVSVLGPASRPPQCSEAGAAGMGHSSTPALASQLSIVSSKAPCPLRLSLIAAFVMDHRRLQKCVVLQSLLRA